MRCFILFFCLTLSTISAQAQVGGKNTFDFLNLPPGARLAGLGGVNVSLADRDLNFMVGNPALFSDSLAGVASASYEFYVADIGQAFVSYAHEFGGAGTFAFAIQHLNYGTINGFDDTGMETAEFQSGETALMVARSHQVNNFRVGATLKAVFSNIAGYRASGLLLDLGGIFIHPEKFLNVGLVIKNLGVMLNDYSDDSSRKLPFDVQLGTTFKPQHMPLRFSLTAYHLTQPDIAFADLSNEESQPGTVAKVLSHVNFGMEILIHRNVNILAGYNYLNHRELKLSGGGGGAGISLGFSARVRQVELAFSRTGRVAGNAGYTFTLASNIYKLIKRHNSI